MTAEEDRLIAFLVGETDRAPKPADYRVPQFTERRPKKKKQKAPKAQVRDTIRVRESS